MGLASILGIRGARDKPEDRYRGSASWIDEEGAYPESDDSFGQVSIGAYKVATMLKVSDELLNDSVFDLEAYISKEFGRRIGTKEEEAFFTGDGKGSVNKIEHIVFAIKLVVHLYGVAFYSDSSLALQIHIVKHLSLQVLAAYGVSVFQQTVGKGTLAMVNMGYDAEISYIFHLDILFHVTKLAKILRFAK